MITNGYATLVQVKAAARVTDAVDDALLEMAVESASRAIDHHCRRRFYTNGTETRVYAADDCYVLDIDDVAGTTVTVATSSALDGVYDIPWASTDFQMEPLNRRQSETPMPVDTLRAVGAYAFPVSQTAGVQVTGVFGFATAVPTEITNVAILLALRKYKRLDSPLGIAGWGDMGAVRVTRIDHDVVSDLEPFVKTVAGVG